MPDRRTFLTLAAGATLAAPLACRGRGPLWDPSAVRRPERSPIAVLPAPRYDAAELVDTVRRGIAACAIDARRKRVVLKPNLVEFDPLGVINTHPVFVAAVVEAFRQEGADAVTVAEGPGHRRDMEYLLRASGLGEQLDDMGAAFVDLNHDRVRRRSLATRFTEFGELWLPETVLGADLFVSLPKLKTHHWAGVTLAMKNLFGIIPGAVYGWPKNPLHWAGLEQSIIDINAAIGVERFNIVDGITGMEGNGPIQGEAKDLGVLVFGADPVAVDATGARLMGLDPWKLGYLASAAEFLGNVGEDRIEMRGEALSRYRADFRVVDDFAHVRIDASAEVRD